jgi:hypothetical protein
VAAFRSITILDRRILSLRQQLLKKLSGLEKLGRYQDNSIDCLYLVAVDRGKDFLAIPEAGKTISYAISTLKAGRLGTGQSQAAKMLVRYPDTAYESHGNYCVYYDLNLPLYNPTDRAQKVTVTLANPIKEDSLSKSGLRFRQPSLDFPFFRGTIRLRYSDETGKQVTRYVHLWQRVGQIVDPLVTWQLKPQEKRSIRVNFFYPPDSTPPQVLTVSTSE